MDNVTLNAILNDARNLDLKDGVTVHPLTSRPGIVIAMGTECAYIFMLHGTLAYVAYTKRGWTEELVEHSAENLKSFLLRTVPQMLKSMF